MSFFIISMFIVAAMAYAVDDAYFSSCRAGDVHAVKSFLDSGVSVHARDAKGNTGLIIASGRGQIEVIQLLLSYGATVEDASLIGIFEGKTAICWASSQGRIDAVALLMQAGANPSKPPNVGVFAGKNALMWAASQGRTEIVRFFISAGINVDYSSSSGNFKGKTALMWACSQGRYDTVQLLLEAGADVNAIDVDGVSALMWASGSEATGNDDHKKGLLEKALKGHVQIVNLLLKHGAKPDMRDKDNINAIMFASFNGHASVVKVLLNAGADANYVNKDNKTALMLARASGHSQVVETISLGPTILNASLEELSDLSTCGWYLSTVRAPEGTGRYFRREYLDINFVPSISIDRTCAVMNENGFDVNMYELLTLVHGSSVESVLNYFGLMIPAVKLRATMQLKFLYDKFSPHFYSIWSKV